MHHLYSPYNLVLRGADWDVICVREALPASLIERDVCLLVLGLNLADEVLAETSAIPTGPPLPRSLDSYNNYFSFY